MRSVLIGKVTIRRDCAFIRFDPTMYRYSSRWLEQPAFEPRISGGKL